MRRTILACAGVLLSVVALGSDSPKEYNDSTILEDACLGEWTRATLRIDGHENAVNDGWTITIHGNSYSARVGTQIDTGPCRIERGSPNRLTLTPPTGRPSVTSGQFLFRVEGDTLILGYYNGGIGRPKGWDDPTIYVSTFKRVKK